jgi:hypothetical protein
MAEQIVRCPYCVVGYEFRPMLHRADGRFICEKCSHIVVPSNAAFRCSCRKCVELNRVA